MRNSPYATILGGLAAVVGFRLFWRLAADVIQYRDVVLDSGQHLSPVGSVLLTFTSLWMIFTGIRLMIRGH